MHLGSEPLRQFRYQSHKPPSVLISPEHCFDAGRPAHDRIPTVRDMDAERSLHASTVCHHAHLLIVEDRPHCPLFADSRQFPVKAIVHGRLLEAGSDYR